jgi:hypothetical protein
MRLPYIPNLRQIVSTVLVATVCIVGRPSPALADDDTASVLALDMDLAVPIDTVDANAGGGAALRAGRKYSLVLVSLTPEVGLGYHRFRGDSGAHLYRGFLGGRVGIGTIIEPSAFAHIGIGRLEHVQTDRFAPVMDVGVALDFTLLPLLNLGIHGAYNSVLPHPRHPSFAWLSAGAHVALVL